LPTCPGSGNNSTSKPRWNTSWNHYAIHDLLRSIQAIDIREQLSDQWDKYHNLALEYLTQHDPHSPDWYYHAIAYDEKQGMLDWWKAVQDPRNNGTTFRDALFEAVYDVTLQLSPGQAAGRALMMGKYFYAGYGAGLDAATTYYEESMSLYKQVGDKLGEANVRKAMGDVQQFRKEMQAALASYEQALGLFRQVGDKLGEANCYLAQGRIALTQGDHHSALVLHDQAFALYQLIQDRYSQVRLLSFRSFVHEAMGNKQLAVKDMKLALKIALLLNLPFIDMFQQRLDELRGE
jgi:tetratricopeptide (TPR) repeat protein